MEKNLNQATHLTDEERRTFGAHYTNAENILKVIKPLFLDELIDEFESIKNNQTKLQLLHQKISNLNFLDPACGGGNFLIVTFATLLDLEKEIISRLKMLNCTVRYKVKASQFYGIEIDANAVVKAYQGFEHLSIGRGLPRIINENALNIDWNEVISKDNLNFIIGNPPFIGASNRTKEQKEEMERVFGKGSKCGNLDYVCAWFKKAAEFMENTTIETAFVSTNSITQGMQPAILWDSLKKHGAEINFAYRSFKWSE